MPRQCKKETACDLQHATNASITDDSISDYCSAATLPWPFEEERDTEKLYTVSDKKIVKTYYTNGNFQCQLTTKSNDLIEIGTTLNYKQFKVLLDVYSHLFSTLTAAYYKGEKSYVIHDLTDGIYASVATCYMCLDVREFYIDKITGNPKATRRGVSYNTNEAKVLHEILKSIDIFNKC